MWVSIRFNFFLLLTFHWGIVDLLYKLDSGVQHTDLTFAYVYEMITVVSLVTICPHKSYCNIIDYILYAVYYTLWLIYFRTFQT